MTEYIDYRAVAKGGRDVNAILRDACQRRDRIDQSCRFAGRRDLHGPRLGAADRSGYEHVHWCGSDQRGGTFLSSADFWDRELATGIQLTAIGGSDNHNAPEQAGTPGAIGWPTTVVEANELSVPAILDGIRRGRVFIDLTGSRDKVIDMEARSDGDSKWTPMGSAIQASTGKASPSASIYLPVRVLRFISFWTAARHPDWRHSPAA